MVTSRVRTVRLATVAVTLSLTLALCSCAANELNVESDSTLAGILLGDGASSQKAAQDVWVAAFQTAHPRTTIEYNPIGSGSGREAFEAGANAFAGSDRPFQLEEIAEKTFTACAPGSGIVEIPAYISPIAIVFNLDGIDSLKLDAGTIARIFSRDIRQWDDEAIGRQNPGVELPDATITAIHRADDSGVTENFTEYLAAAAPQEWRSEPSGEWPLHGGEAANQTSGVVSSVTSGVGTIAYVDGSRAADLNKIAVTVGDDHVLPSASAAAAIVDASPMETGRTPGDLVIQLDRTTTADGVYPIVLISYLIGCVKYRDAATAELVKSYLDFVISDSAQLRAQEYAGSAPISAGLFERASAATALIH